MSAVQLASQFFFGCCTFLLALCMFFVVIASNWYSNSNSIEQIFWSMFSHFELFQNQGIAHKPLNVVYGLVLFCFLFFVFCSMPCSSSFEAEIKSVGIVDLKTDLLESLSFLILQFDVSNSWYHLSWFRFTGTKQKKGRERKESLIVFRKYIYVLCVINRFHFVLKSALLNNAYPLTSSEFMSKNFRARIIATE